MNYGATAHGEKALINFNNEIRPLASPVDIIDSIVITEELDPTAILAQWIAYDPSIAIYSDLVATQAVKLFINWSDRNGTVDLHQGDYFTFVVPDIFLYEYVQNATDVPITNNAGEVVATYSIYDNSNNMKEVRITFTDYVENHTNISGDFWMLLFVGNVVSQEQKTIEFVINDSLVAQGEVTVIPHTGTLTPRNRKVGYSLPSRSAGGYYIFEWIVYVNMGENAVNGFNTLEGFSFEDIIPANSPHIFLSDRIRQELGILPTDYQAEIGEYTGADLLPPESRYQRFLYQYNSTGSDIWYNSIDWNTLVNGLTSVGINGDGGLNVSDIEVSDKLYSANLGTLTRPTAIRFYTIATVKMTESALGDIEVVGLFKNTFKGSYGEDLSSTLTLYRFEAGGSAQGIFGDYNFSFNKVNEQDSVLSGALFSLFTSENFEEGADRFVFSDINGLVAFNNLPTGTYYVLETLSPIGYIPNSIIYKVVLTTEGFEIYYGDNFENRLSDIDNEVVNISENGVQPTLVILSGRKNLTGFPLQAGMFSYLVKNNEGNIVATGTNNADGSIQFSSIEYDTAGVYSYTIEEVTGYDARIIYDGSIFTVTVTVTNENQSLVADVVYPTGGIVFNNSFVVTPVSVVLSGTKNLIGSTLETGMFSFVVRNSVGNIIATGTNNADGSIQFSNIIFDTAGVYTLTVEEVMGSESGIIYDGSIFTVTVTVTVNLDGNLVAEVVYPTGGIVFNNSFVVTPVSVVLSGTKNLIGNTLETGMFSFVVRNSVGNIIATGTNNADGSIQFSNIIFDTAGVYTLTVEEVMGSESGIIYDGSIFTVTVTVTVNPDGNLVAEVVYPTGGIVFNNSFVVTPVSVVLSGTKNLIGSTLETGMFSYIVRNSAGNIIATGTNNADGSIQFSNIIFDTAGVYTLTVEEVMGSESGIIYDGSIFTVTVTVTVNPDGGLVAEVTYPSGGIVFNNSFVVTPTSIVLSGTKNLTGFPIQAGMFSYVVKNNEGNIVATGTNNADGSIQFSSIEYNTTGVYSYTVEEIMGYDARIIYDGSVFTIMVTVTSENEHLVADVTYPTGGIVFNNRFIATPVSVILSGTKKLTCKSLEDDMFSFIVKDSEGNTVATGTNNADGSIQFSSITFDTAGVYTFTVEEVMGSDSGIIYDSTIFTVTVTVTVNTGGDLVAEVAYPVGGIVFNNRSVVTPEKPICCVPCCQPCCKPCDIICQPCHNLCMPVCTRNGKFITAYRIIGCSDSTIRLKQDE